MFDDEDARGRAEQPARVRQRASPAAASRPQPGDRARSDPLLRDLVAGHAEPRPRRDTQLARFFRALGRTAAIVAPVGRDAGGAVRQPRHHVQRAAPTVARPFLQDSITGGPPALDAGDHATSRSSGRSWPTPTGLFRELQPGRAGAARRPRRRWPTRSTIGTPHAARARRRSTSSLGPPSRSCSASPTTRSCRSASTDLTSTVDVAGRRRSRYLDAGPDGLQLRRRCSSATSSSLLSDGDANGTWQRFIIIATPQGPNNEGGPSSAPANGARRSGQLPAHQPVPEHGLAGPAEGVRGRQRALPRRQDRSSATCRAPSRDHRDDDGGSADGSDAATPTTSACRARTARARARSRSALVALVARRDRVFLGFTKHIPFTHGYQRQGASSSRPTRSGQNSPVRIAGVNVGKVKKIEPQAGHRTPPS